MTRAPRSKMARAPFVAWDSEGLGRGARHRLVLLTTDAGAVIQDADGFTPRTMLGALWRGLVRRPDALHVAFAFGYDVMMLLRDLPRPVLATLWADGACRWGPYRITYEPRRSFRLARYQHGRWTGGRIWDVFGFFQSSFVTALEKYDLARATRAQIAAMKARRSSFQRRDLPAMARYAQDECAALVELMNAVRAAALGAGLALNRWDGAGAVASAFLRAHKAQEYLPRGPTPIQGDPWPAAVRTGARHAYFGGRIEVGRVGHHAGAITRYDVRSAYPSILATLPAGGGGWSRTPSRSPFLPSLHYIAWDFAPGARWYPFPWRARDGAVLYPAKGEGWYWYPEVEAAFFAQQAGQLKGEIIGRETWHYDVVATTAPWGWVADLYQRRAALKLAGDGAEKMVKLGLNSLYGKLAQSLGGTATDAPRWHCLEWAGYITSAIRAKLYTAALAAGPKAIALATDALFTTGPVAALDRDVGEGLGQWERTRYESGTWVQSGVYWVGGGRPDGKIFRDHESAYHRGFTPSSLHRADVLAAWRRGQASLPVADTRFQALGASVGSASAFQRRAQWITSARQLTLAPYAGQKRLVPLTLRPRQLAAGLHWTVPRALLASEGYDPQQPTLSAPVALPWAPEGIAPPDSAASTEYDPGED